MPQLFSQILKPFVNKNVFRHNIMVRTWRSSTQGHGCYPIMLIDHILKVGDSSDGRIERGDESLGEKEVLIKDPKLAEVVRSTMNIILNQRGQDIHMVEKTEYTLPKFIDNVHLYMEYVSSRKITKNFYFPSLPKGSQVQNIAMSSCPDINNEDWVMAVKFSGSKLKLYRHNKDFRWIDIETTHESISPHSSLMYSKKDQRFYVPAPGCNYLCSFDLNFKEKDKLEFVEVRKKDLPKYELFELMEMNAFTRTDHMVESPSGEHFLISWYYGDEFELYKTLTVIHKTKSFKVFREDEQLTDRKTKFMSYTENIGDLCIFLGHGEAMCVPASTIPGLKPNCIYFAGHNYGVFDITTQTCSLFSTDEGLLSSTQFPSWPHPLSLTPN
ncbi:hypothetical protein ISN44_As13g001830 [Arabidopsis suecica]|uniref:KIB1-4 beta-propeller domain-containing protein n=1 Tax=Arabidopsis suecica TaxID=45249 RepID=A0A8T1XWB6_ARASU|nr:hypothetical protein ISN44_As13g001830 [Arabidopsis suecica]